MKIISLKKMSIPKIAVLATGAVAALLVATVSPQAAQARPTYGVTCIGCHTAGGSVTAIPSNANPAPGDPYTVAIAITTAGSGNSGFNISLAGTSLTTGGPASGKTFTANMTAPTAAGSYTYNVGADTGAPPGEASATTYTITVAPVVTTTTTTTPPTSTTTTSEPPTSTTTTPPVSIARIRSLSPDHGTVGTKVKVRGANFGTSGVVKFGNVTAKASSWTNTSIVVKVPNIAFSMSSKSATVPVWYRHDKTVSVTVTPTGAAASNAVHFSLDSRHGHGHGHGDGHSDN